MEFPPDQVEGIADLDLSGAIELRARANEGNLGALAEWTVWALIQRFKRYRYSHQSAIDETKALLSRVDLRPRIVNNV